MTRFETKDGLPLGARFSGDVGITIWQSDSEQKLLFSLDDQDEVMGDFQTHIEFVHELKALFQSSPHASKAELIRRGWGDRIGTGLALRTVVTKDGRIAITT